MAAAQSSHIAGRGSEMSRSLAICLLLAGCSTACGGSDPEAVLRARIRQYEKSWAAQQFGDVWRMMSPRLRDGNENDQSKFERFVRDSGMMVSQIQPQEIRIAGDRATVRAIVTYRSASGEELGEQIEESQWVLSGGEWLFDDYRLVAAPR